MKSVINLFKRVPKKVLMLALIIAVAASMVAVAGTFAVFKTTVIGIGETPISDWNFDVRINNDEAINSIVTGVKLSGDNETTEINSVTYNLHKTRDDSNHIKDYQIAPGTSGYMPIEIDGSTSKVAIVITVKAEFSYTTGFSFTDNLRRTLAVTAESENYSYEDEDSNAVNATYVGYITYSYYVSYEQMSHWAENDYIDIGFRWDWSEDDDTTYADIPEYVYTRISVTGKQITNANQIKSADTVINFIWDDTKTVEEQLRFGNVLNIINTVYDTDVTLVDGDITGDLYLDVNANGFTETSATKNPYEVLLTGDVSIATTQDVKFVLGTNRSQHGYLYEYIDEAVYGTYLPAIEIDAPNADAYISNDFTLTFVKTANNLVDILNAGMERMGESQAKTMYEALTFVVNDSTASAALADYNANVNVTDVTTLETIISTQYGNCDVVWDSASNRFAYISSDGKTVVQKDDISTIDLSKKYKLFKTYSAMPATQTYSIYALDAWTEATVAGLTVGFDAGVNSDEITSITYNRATATTAQDVVIRTNSANTNLTVDAPLDTVKHYGSAGVVDLQRVASSSYYEHGSVAFVELTIGRIVLTEDSDVEVINVTKKDDNSYNNPIICDGGILSENMPAIVSRDQVNVTSGDGKTELVQIQKLDAVGNKVVVTEQIYAYASGTIGTTEQTETQNTDISTNLGVMVLDKIGEAGEKAYSTEAKETAKDEALNEALSSEVLASDDNFVARIGMTGYTSLDDAFDAVQEGETIAVLQDCEIANTYTINKNLTFDLSDKTVTVSTTGYAFDVLTDTNGKTLTLKNGTFSGINNPKGVVQIATGSATANLVLTKVNIYGATSNDTFTTNDGVIADNTAGTGAKNDDTDRADTITLTNVNIRTAGDIVTGTAGRAYASVYVTGGTYISGARGFRFCGTSDSMSIIDGANITTSNGIAVYPFSNAILKNTIINMTATGNNDAVSASGAYNTGATLTIENTSVTANGTAASAVATETMGNVVITGGTFVNNNTSKPVVKVNTTGGCMIINGGTFSTETHGATQTSIYANTEAKHDDSEHPSILKVNDGTFYGGADVSSDSARIEIYGGTFKDSIHFYVSGNSYVKLMPDNTAVFEDGYTTD